MLSIGKGGLNSTNVRLRIPLSRSNVTNVNLIEAKSSVILYFVGDGKSIDGLRLG